MIQVEQLFEHRMKSAWQTGLRYFRLIGGSGSVPILLLIIGILFTHAYTTFLAWLPAAFPAYILMALVMAAMLTTGSVRTFLVKPDVVFLLPAEHRMHRYFQSGLRYSALIQSIMTSAIMGLLFPLYFTRIGSVLDFMMALGFVIVFQVGNVYAHWRELALQNGRGRQKGFRFFANLLLTVMLFYGGNLWLYIGITTVIGIMLVFYYRQLGQNGHLPWHRLVALEQRKVARYYAIAGFFVDIPRFGRRVKRRPGLSRLTNLIPYNRKYAYVYLYLRTLIRSGEYLGITLRLTIVMVVVVWFLTNVYITMAVLIVGLLATGIQLPAIWSDHRHALWMKLYPLDIPESRKSFIQLVVGLLTLQSLVINGFLLVSGRALPEVALLFGIGIVFSYVFGFYYVPRRLKGQHVNN